MVRIRKVDDNPRDEIAATKAVVGRRRLAHCCYCNSCSWVLG
jgi:hypothetical protein